MCGNVWEWWEMKGMCCKGEECVVMVVSVWEGWGMVDRAASGEFGFTPFLIKNVRKTSIFSDCWALLPIFTPCFS